MVRTIGNCVFIIIFECFVKLWKVYVIVIGYRGESQII